MSGNWGVTTLVWRLRPPAMKDLSNLSRALMSDPRC